MAGVLDRVAAAVRDGAVVLVTPPGTGKTTRVPPALADGIEGGSWRPSRGESRPAPTL
ncbi:hypothetical protein [Dactylosporangium sp. NPDC048998]|uniref:hypothetical protein n=1 Tax=Dactylosporangium sp. NPDC048998 TaxID=3363976 RepID=UPI00371356EA